MAKKKKKKYTPLRGRVYVHEKCGAGTRVSDNDFVGLCNPFEPCMGTICSTCGAPDSLSKFAWEDTGEKLNKYRKRLRKKAPVIYQLWCRLLSPLLGAVIGGGIGFALTSQPELNGTFGAIIGAALMFFFLGSRILSLIVGDYFYSQK